MAITIGQIVYVVRQSGRQKKGDVWHVGGAFIAYPYHRESSSSDIGSHGGILVSAIGLIVPPYRSYVTHDVF